MLTCSIRVSRSSKAKGATICMAVSAVTCLPSRSKQSEKGKPTALASTGDATWGFSDCDKKESGCAVKAAATTQLRGRWLSHKPQVAATRLLLPDVDAELGGVHLSIDPVRLERLL